MSKRSGVRCRRDAIVGGTVCPMHGGSSPQVKAAAERRVADAAAQVVVRRFLDNPDAPPVADPVGSLLRLTGRLEAALDWAGGRVNELGDAVRYEGRGPGAGEQQRGELTLWVTLVKELRGALVDINRLGLEEKRVAIAGAEVVLIGGLFERMLSRLELSASQWELVRTVVPEELERAATDSGG
jgi:hypothetical protein